MSALRRPVCLLTHFHGRTFFSNISSSSAGVLREVSGMMNQVEIISGAETPATVEFSRV
jgi:hypothetical protein